MDHGKQQPPALVADRVDLTDKEYLTEALPLGNGGFEGWGTPRTVAVELLYQM